MIGPGFSAWRQVAGLVLLAAALLGLLLPLVQAVLFGALGLFLLRHQYGWAGRVFDPVRRRFPEIFARLEALEAQLVAWAGTLARRLRGGPPPPPPPAFVPPPAARDS